MNKIFTLFSLLLLLLISCDKDNYAEDSILFTELQPPLTVTSVDTVVYLLGPGYYAPSPEDSTATISLDINNDGIDDFLQIDIQLEAIGYNANILLFDSKGILINTLVSNIFLGSKNTFYWNGLDQNGNVVPMGRYIILLNAIHTSNPIISQKKTVVVTY